MFEFLKNHYTTKLIIELNNAMPHYNAIKKTTRKQQHKQKAKTKTSRQKLNILKHLVTTSNYKMQKNFKKNRNNKLQVLRKHKLVKPLKSLAII